MGLARARAAVQGKRLHALAVAVYALSTLVLLGPSVGRAPSGIGPTSATRS